MARPNRSTAVREHWPIIALLLVQLLNGVVVSAQRFFFPIYVTEALGLAAVIASTFISISRVVGMGAALAGGGLIDSIGRKWTLVAGLGCFVLSNLAFFAGAPWMVALLWAVTGLAMSFASLGAAGYLIHVATGQRLGTISALYHWGLTLGGALGSPIAGRVLDTRGYGPFAYLLMGFAALNALLAMVLMPNLGRRRINREREPWRMVVAGYLEVVRQPLVWRLSLLRFLPTCYYGMSMVLIPLLIYAATGSKTAVAVFVTLSQVLATLAQLIAGRAADRGGAQAPTLIAMGLVTLGAAGKAFLASHTWALFVFGCIGVAAAWALSTLMPVLISSAVAPEAQGRVLGSLYLVWNLAMILGALVGGTLVDVRAGLPFAIAALLSGMAILFVRSFFAKL
jgi:MFS family permease